MTPSQRRVLTLAFLALTGWAAAGTQAADEAPWIDQLRAAFCVPVETPPVIDGKLDDPCWKDAPVQTGFFLHGSPGRAKCQTEFMCARDKTAIYFAFRGYAIDLEKRVSKARERDGAAWADDSVELFLWPAETPANKVRFQLVVNSLGAIYDARTDRTAKQWNSSMTVAVGSTPTEGRAGYGTLEMAVPFADLEATPTDATVWRVNVCRTSTDLGEQSTWMPILVGGFDQPDRYGRLLMRKPTAEDLAQQAAYEKFAAGKETPGGPVETAIRLDDAPVMFQKAMVSDSRVLRAFVGDPVDGTLRSVGYTGTTPVEYPREGVGAGISYHYNNNDGLHITLADDRGVDVVVMRRFAKTRMYADASAIAKPGTGKLLWTFLGSSDVEVARLPERAKTRRISFFETRGGQIADVAFYRVEKPAALGERETWVAGEEAMPLPEPASKYDASSLAKGMEELYAKDERRTLPLRQGTAGKTPLTLDTGGTVHLVTEPFAEERGLAAVGFEARLLGAKTPARVTFVAQDPLNPRRDLAWLRFVAPESGLLRITVDIPDQVLLKGSRLWLTLMCDQPAQIGGVEGGAPVFHLHFIPREKALSEALAFRKFLLLTLFGPISEPRPWGNFRRGMTREEFYAKTGYADCCPEFFMTIDQCSALDPNDDLARQFREWVFYRHFDKMSPVAPPPTPPLSAPDWAWYARLAWLEMRRITDWWMEERMVPTGEVGVGGIQDDGDLYQQFADVPFFETGGVAAKVLDGAARIAELVERDHVKGGINVHATDSLHAYEEGINHLATTARWFYGDPIYMERCMDSARNMEKLTVVMPDGRRHFRSHSRMGYDDVLHPAEPEVDGSSAPLMWHTTLQVADYNRNPLALRVLREWADTWMKFMNPPDWPIAIEVKTGKVLSVSKDRPYMGGYSSQAVTFVWLHALTGDKRYIEPFLYYYRKGEAPYPANRFLGDVIAAGGLDGVDAKALEKLAGASPEAAIFLKGDPKPLQRALIGRPDLSQQAAVDNICDARRFPDMYTTTHQYTDRVLLGDLQTWAAVSYLGGHTKRNKHNPTHAVSWEGFGDGFGALVLQNRRDGLKALLYNFGPTTLQGGFRVWALDHGEYRVAVGLDEDGDAKADRVIHETTRELTRADRTPLALAPRVVTVIEVAQTRRLDPIYGRADLALAAREVSVKGDTLTGVAHNIGSADAADVVAAVVDVQGRQVAKQSLGKLEAPLDLVPRRKEFTLKLPAGPRLGWRLVLDPEGVVPEIFEGNNEVSLDDLPAVDYRKGWE